ncbi:hypothetical protein I4436_06050 [Pseudomonas qingdaonensis]|uniref:hypothetical protein n=1 Tax=Pseudomonas qingdaonensis TaxID=2056231 RepID=UPI0018C97089|nr:hypothetical protein [Pseudomonas qingdaonensis]MBG8559170.1 hypothetical protein [Pseudomonas qingdaonensis]
MTEKTVEQMARDTLNALISGGRIPEDLVYKQGNRLELDKISLRQVEEQLREYYSTGLYEKKPSKAGVRSTRGLA